MKTKNITKTLFIAIMILNCNILFGQISDGGTPYSFSINRQKATTSQDVELSDKIPTFKMPKINKTKIDSIKQSNKLLGANYQFAYGFNVNIDIKTSSVVDSLDIGLLYRLSIKSEKAYSINLIFKKFILPKGAELFIYSTDKEDIKGAFTSVNNKESNRLPTLPVKGEKIIVEYFEPHYTEFEGQLLIGKVNHDFLDVLNTENKIEDDFGSSGGCQVDINCLEGDDWQTEKRAVCRIVKNGDTWCTGTLLNNSNLDGIPYFLGAFHCLDYDRNGSISSDEESSLSDWTFIFNYESPSCNGGDGSTSQSISSATLRAARYQSDFILLELSHKPLSTYNPYYAGWDRNNNQDAGGVCIHHPAGDVKKISTFNMAPVSSYCISGYPQNNFYLIDKWIKTTNGHGVTERGSSGSPLFNNNHHVIGQLYGGCPGHNSNCSNPSNDYSNYGKIFSSWNLGSNSGSRLEDWLDPINNNPMVFDGANVCSQPTAEHHNITHTIKSGEVEIYRATKTITATNTIKSGATVTYEAGERITLKPPFVAESGSNFTARIKNLNCLPGCYPVLIDLLPNVFTPNGDGINDQLCYPVSNATSYEFKAFNRWGSEVYSSSGNVTGNMACVWDGTGSCSGCWYAVIITFRNECHEKSEAYGVTVYGSKNKSTKQLKSTSSDTIKAKNDLLLNIIPEHDTNDFDFKVYPNPTTGNFTLEVQAKETFPYSLEIINTVGDLIYKIKKLNVDKINVNKIGFSSGIYYIRLNNGNSVITKKIIIH